MKKSAVIAGIGLFLAIVSVAGVLFFVKMRSIRAAANQPAFEMAEAVMLSRAEMMSWRPTSDLVGTVIALRSVTVQNEVEGVIKEVGFESGSIVEAGQMLVTLDDSTARAELSSAEAALRVAQADIAVVEATIRLAESEFRRQEAALQSRATSAIEVDRARAELERTTAERLAAEARVEQARAMVDEVRTRLAKHVIRAPFRARVGLRSVQPGQFLAAPMGSDSTAIATLQEVADSIFIDFAIPQEHVSRVVIGTKVDGVMEDPGSPAGGIPITLEVAALDAVANNATRNVRVRSIAPNPSERLRPGMFMKVRVPVDEARAFVSVPVTAVRRAAYADQVFVVESTEEPGPAGAPETKMRARQRFVRLGPTVGDRVIVLDGLVAGEMVAASGSFKLRDGALVRPGEASGAAAPEGGLPAVGSVR